MQEFLFVAKAIAEDSRLRILNLLKDGELCVCQIVEVLQLAPSTVSKHLSILEYSRMVESEKRGKWVYYSLTSKPFALVKAFLKLVYSQLEGEKQIKSDNKQLQKILKTPLEELCRKKN